MSSYTLNESILGKKIGNEVFFFDRDNSVIHSFNQTGSFIAAMILDNTEPEMIVRHLCEEFDIDPDTARSDIHETLATMMEKKILTLSGAPDA